MPTTDILSDYKKHVERMFDEGSSIMFTNKDRDHAAILISTLFKKAENEVVVLCKNLDSEFYGRDVVKTAIVDALSRGVKLRMRVQEQPEATELVKILTETRSENVDFKICEPGSRSALSLLNFTVTDKKSFRLEQDRSCHAAVACANNPEVANQILSVYDSLG
jgi:hypothetical protein